MKKIVITISFILMALTFNSCTSNEKVSKRDVPGNGRMEQGGQQGPDLVAAAEKLGVTVAQLEDALGDMSKQMTPEKLKDIANKLGVTEEELLDALGPPPGGPKK